MGPTEQTYDLVKPHVSGLVHTTLALRDFGQMVPFRAAASEVLRSMLRLYPRLQLDEDALAPVT